MHTQTHDHTRPHTLAHAHTSPSIKSEHKLNSEKALEIANLMLPSHKSIYNLNIAKKIYKECLSIRKQWYWCNK